MDRGSGCCRRDHLRLGRRANGVPPPTLAARMRLPTIATTSAFGAWIGGLALAVVIVWLPLVIPFGVGFYVVPLGVGALALYSLMVRPRAFAASGALLGLAAFAVLFAGALVRLYRAAPRIGRLAFAALLMRVVQGQFDVFWVTAQAAIPWMIVGLALGADVRARALRAGLSSGRRARAHRPLAAARARQGP